MKGKEEAQLSNPYEGLSCARQLEESADVFLQRLPPSRTRLSEETPWIYVANPFRKVAKRIKEKSGDVATEGPPGDESEWSKFVVHGNQLLEKLKILQNEINKENYGKTKATITKKINVERDKIVKEMLDTAIDLHCTSGKVISNLTFSTYFS